MEMSKDLQHRFEDLIAYISATNEAVLGGEIRKLEMLDETVETLCHDTLSKSSIVARDMQPFMAETISKLDELEQNLTTFKSQHEGRKS